MSERCGVGLGMAEYIPCQLDEGHAGTHSSRASSQSPSGSSVPEAARAAARKAGRAAYEEADRDVWCGVGPSPLDRALLAAAAAAVAEERATTGRRVEAAARKHIVQLEAERPPCDEGCQDYPEETCSRHGRKVREVWEMLAALNTRIEAVLRLCEDAEMHQHVPPDTPLGPWVSTRPLRAALASPGEGE